MTSIATVCGRLQRDEELPALLDAAYTAFDVLLSAIEDQQDPASGMFASFVSAATSAANGRDAILFAPSLPAHPLHRAGTGTNGQDSGTDVPQLVTLSKTLCRSLAQAAATVPGQEDRAACRNAARCAAEIHRLLTGAEP